MGVEQQRLVIRVTITQFHPLSRARRMPVWVARALVASLHRSALCDTPHRQCNKVSGAQGKCDQAGTYLRWMKLSAPIPRAFVAANLATKGEPELGPRTSGIEQTTVARSRGPVVATVEHGCALPLPSVQRTSAFEYGWEQKNDPLISNVFKVNGSGEARTLICLEAHQAHGKSHTTRLFATGRV